MKQKAVDTLKSSCFLSVAIDGQHLASHKAAFLQAVLEAMQKADLILSEAAGVDEISAINPNARCTL